MMITLGPALLALFVATFFTLLELITSEYPRTYPLLLKVSNKIYAYSIIYGLIAFGTTLGIDSLVTGDIVSIEGPGLTNIWIRALVIGFTVKAFLHVRLFTVGISGREQFPIGIETIVQLFEPWLLRDIKIDHFNSIRSYIQPRLITYNELTTVKQTIESNIPTTLPEAERKAFQQDISQAASIPEAMELFIGFLGLGSFERAFP